LRPAAFLTTLAEMPDPGFLSRLRAIRWDPIYWTWVSLQTFWRALTRLWGRDVMLYTGGV
jgi:membrane protein